MHKEFRRLSIWLIGGFLQIMAERIKNLMIFLPLIPIDRSRVSIDAFPLPIFLLSLSMIPVPPKIK